MKRGSEFFLTSSQHYLGTFAHSRRTRCKTDSWKGLPNQSSIFQTQFHMQRTGRTCYKRMYVHVEITWNHCTSAMCMQVRKSVTNSNTIKNKAPSCMNWSIRSSPNCPADMACSRPSTFYIQPTQLHLNTEQRCFHSSLDIQSDRTRHLEATAERSWAKRCIDFKPPQPWSALSFPSEFSEVKLEANSICRITEALQGSIERKHSEECNRKNELKWFHT